MTIDADKVCELVDRLSSGEITQEEFCDAFIIMRKAHFESFTDEQKIAAFDMMVKQIKTYTEVSIEQMFDDDLSHDRNMNGNNHEHICEAAMKIFYGDNVWDSDLFCEE